MECKDCRYYDLDVDGSKDRVEIVTLCPQCRAALELGRLVRAMPVGSGLFRESSSWAYDRDVINGSDEACGETPEEALKALKGE